MLWLLLLLLLLLSFGVDIHFSLFHFAKIFF